MTMKMDRMTIHAQISEADSNALVQFHNERIGACQTRLLKVNRLKSVMMFGFLGVEVPGSTNHSCQEYAKVQDPTQAYIRLSDE